ncbi:MAG: four helix bundle suffix domain-containing protein [Patescibacteria group bacterium]|jgi:four helix bundle suffix protein
MPQSGYKNLASFKMATIVYDLTVIFCQKFLAGKEYGRLVEQMIQAARSGRQNIAEGSVEKSLKMYIKLTGVAKASQEELLLDYQDFLRQRNLELLGKDHEIVRGFREFRAVWVDLGHLNTPDLPSDPKIAANMLITFINQTTFLLGKQITSLEEKFKNEGGYSEKLFNERKNQKYKGN